MRFVCWITKSTNTHSEYLVLIALLRQQWLRKCASKSTLHVHCLSCIYYKYRLTAVCQFTDKFIPEVKENLTLSCAIVWEGHKIAHWKLSYLCQRMRLAEHVTCMGKKRGAYGLAMGKYEGRILSTPRHSRDNNTKMGLQGIGWGAWFGFIWLRIGTNGQLL